MKQSLGILFILVFYLVMCDTNPFHPDKELNLIGNQAPETYLFLFLPEDDPGGEDSLEPTETPERDSLPCGPRPPGREADQPIAHG